MSLNAVSWKINALELFKTIQHKPAIWQDLTDQDLEESDISVIFYCWLFQGKKSGQEGGGDGELKKFDGTGYDSDLVDALERDIISRNPNISW